MRNSTVRLALAAAAALTVTASVPAATGVTTIPRPLLKVKTAQQATAKPTLVRRPVTARAALGRTAKTAILVPLPKVIADALTDSKARGILQRDATAVTELEPLFQGSAVADPVRALSPFQQRRFANRARTASFRTSLGSSPAAAMARAGLVPGEQTLTALVVRHGGGKGGKGGKGSHGAVTNETIPAVGTIPGAVGVRPAILTKLAIPSVVGSRTVVPTKPAIPSVVGVRTAIPTKPAIPPVVGARTVVPTKPAIPSVVGARTVVPTRPAIPSVVGVRPTIPTRTTIPTKPAIPVVRPVIPARTVTPTKPVIPVVRPVIPARTVTPTKPVIPVVRPVVPARTLPTVKTPVVATRAPVVATKAPVVATKAPVVATRAPVVVPTKATVRTLPTKTLSR